MSKVCNTEVHLNCGVHDPEKWENYIQIQEKAEILTDPAEKEAFWNDQLVNIFKGPDDPNYAIVKVTPYRIEVNSMGSLEPEVWEG
ncbi:MAG: pyridoxamine 5'-phosphate oxidase family protein [Bacteroidales bacterium]|nr:pyridoxamine 5'-phosphate oxidase family protein [Candidatus Latescibacterota bacterium]